MEVPDARVRDAGRGPVPSARRPLAVRAWWMAGAYAVVAALWILFSDRWLAGFGADSERIIQWSAFKGYAFVAVTSVVLLVVLRRAFRAVDLAAIALKERERVGRIHEDEIRRLTRLSVSLSQIDQAIVRTTDRTDLFEKVCRILVEFGGLRMAWVGWHDPETERIVPAARWGEDLGYLDSVQIYADERLEGQGPSGQAFRSGAPYVSNDLLLDPAMTHWREEASTRGYRALAALPIHVDDRTVGLLNVYAGERGFFEEKEMALLKSATSDVAYALENLAREDARRRAQELAESEKLFSDTMIDSMPGILYLYTREGGFLRWNRNFEVVSGYDHDEIAGMHPLDFFEVEYHPLLEANIARVFRGGEAAVEAPFRARDGSTTPHFFTGRRVIFGGEECLVGVGIDISQRVQAEAERGAAEERFRSTLENVLEGCQIIGFDWRYLYLNPASARHNRRPNHELQDRTMMDVWPGIEGTQVFALFRRCMEDRSAVHEEVEVNFPDGSSGWFDVRCQPVPEGIFVLSIEQSERRAAERELRQLNQTLERRVEERTEELQTALVRAEAADHLKSAFLATMSHELRTPLNSIIGFTGILLQELAGPLTAEQAKQLGMVQRSARHLLALITDVLDLSKIEAGQLEVRREEVDLPVLVQTVTDTLRPQADAKELTLEAHVDPDVGSIVSDRRRVEQILLNLLSNGIKFTDRGAVTLDVQRTNGTVQLRVTDTGMGIREEDLAKLFLPFRQIDAGLTRQHEGTGLGLAICRRLAHLLGGEISATSEWSRGSEFLVTLPSSHHR